MGNSLRKKLRGIQSNHENEPNQPLKSQTMNAFVHQDPLKNLQGRRRSFQRKDALQPSGLVLVRPSLKLSHSSKQIERPFHVEVDLGTPRDSEGGTKRLFEAFGGITFDRSILTTRNTEATQRDLSEERGKSLERNQIRRRSKNMKTIFSNDGDLESQRKTNTELKIIDERSPKEGFSRFIPKSKKKMLKLPYHLPVSPRTAAKVTVKSVQEPTLTTKSANFFDASPAKEEVNSISANKRKVVAQSSFKFSVGGKNNKVNLHERLLKAIVSNDKGDAEGRAIRKLLQKKNTVEKIENHDTLVHLVKNKVSPTDFVMGQMPQDQKIRAVLRTARPTDWPQAFTRKGVDLEDPEWKKERATFHLAEIDQNSSPRRKTQWRGILTVIRPNTFKPSLKKNLTDSINNS